MAAILKKIPFIVFLMLFFLFDATAMPPHPSKQGNTVRERLITVDPMEDPLLREAMLRGQQASPMAKSFSSAGNGVVEMNILVILAGFGANLAEQPVIGAPLGGNNIFNKSGYLIPALLLILLIIQILFKTKKRYVLLNAYLLIALSCAIEGESINRASGDPKDFTTPKSKFENMLGAKGAEAYPLTMKKYWEDMSNGNFILNIDVVGPVTVSQGWQYYGKNRGGMDDMPGEFVSEAVRLAHNLLPAGGFAKYANFGSSIVDTVIVVFAGPGEENANGPADAIWSHQWDLLSASRSKRGGRGPIPFDGVVINNYIVVPEFTHGGGSSIGVFCHEFGHVLGLSDLYDTSGDTRGVGSWSLMSHGSWGSNYGVDPAPLLAWERRFIAAELSRRRGGAHVNPWVTIEELKTFPQNNISVGNIESTRKAYKIPLNSNASQYLILEGKEPIRAANSSISDGRKYVPGSPNTPGILITHINETIISKYSANNRVNAGKFRTHGITIVEAGDALVGGAGYLWNEDYIFKPAGGSPGYDRMLFRRENFHDTIHRPTTLTSATSAPDLAPYPNSNYHTSEDRKNSKTGYSGIEITVGNGNTVTITRTP